jgi:hypothetical protein
MRAFLIIFCFFLFAAQPVHADSIERVTPTAQKLRLCEAAVRRHGWRSVDINNDWYGRGVLRPAQTRWHLNHTRTNWSNTKLFYWFSQTTADGFEHNAICTFFRADGNYELSITHHNLGGRAVCDRYSISGRAC